ncbi:MAG: hypothetical protein M3Q07_13830 [Pseudobdellovibrionaceae bacterium]|nr:hypothetical protein [Pseudobdellovibrionaceae bacterium]
MTSLKNLALATALTLSAAPSAWAADCRTTLTAFFNTIQAQNYSVHVERTTNALWSNDNIFSTYSNFSTYVQGSNSAGPNRFIKEESGVRILNSNGGITRVDQETVSIVENGAMSVVLNSWSNTILKPTMTYCDSIGNDQVLIQAIHSSGTRKTLYNFTLTKTIIVL